MKISVTNTGPIMVEQYGNGLMIGVGTGAHVEIDGKAYQQGSTGGKPPTDVTAPPAGDVYCTVDINGAKVPSPPLIPWASSKYPVTLGAGNILRARLKVPPSARPAAMFQLVAHNTDGSGAQTWHTVLSVAASSQSAPVILPAQVDASINVGIGQDGMQARAEKGDEIEVTATLVGIPPGIGAQFRFWVNVDAQ